MTQVERLRALMDDGQPHRTDEIVERVYGPGCALARVAARVSDLKKRLPQGWSIKGWHDPKNAALYFYQIIKPAPLLDLFGKAMVILICPWWLLA